MTGGEAATLSPTAADAIVSVTSGSDVKVVAEDELLHRTYVEANAT
jgi:hypothetical protein